MDKECVSCLTNCKRELGLVSIVRHEAVATVVDSDASLAHESLGMASGAVEGRPVPRSRKGYEPVPGEKRLSPRGPFCPGSWREYQEKTECFESGRLKKPRRPIRRGTEKERKRKGEESDDPAGHTLWRIRD